MSHSQERVRIVDGPKPSVGFAELNDSGTWKRFCRPWGKNPTQVFCRQLGYAGGLKSIGWPTNDTVPKITRLLFCKGHEKHILECGFINSNVDRCHNNPAVVCQDHVSG